MRNVITQIVLLVFTAIPGNAQTKKIIIEAEFQDSSANDSARLGILDIYRVGSMNPEETRNNSFKEKIVNGKVKFSIPCNTVIRVYADFIGKGYFLGEPGDSIYIKHTKDGVSYTGTGHEKFVVATTAHRLNNNISRPSSGIRKSNDMLSDYLKYSNELKLLIPKKLVILEEYKSKISKFAFRYLQSCFTFKEEKKIQDDFITLKDNTEKLGISAYTLSNIFDSTLASSPFHQLSLHLSDTACLPDDIDGYLLSSNSLIKNRSNNFKRNQNIAFKRDTLIQSGVQTYYNIKNYYTGLAREKAQSRLIQVLVKEYGFQPSIESMIQDYLSSTDYPAIKEWTQSYIMKKAAVAVQKPAPEFTVHDRSGKSISLSDHKGKYLLLDFWFTGCTACVKMSGIMKQIEQQFQDNPHITFLSVSIDRDKDKWLKSVEQGVYTSGSGINAFTNGLGNDHSIINDYSVTSFPTLLLISPEGYIMDNYNPRIDSGAALTAFLKKRIAVLSDGPYVIYDKTGRRNYAIQPGTSGKLQVQIVHPPMTVVTNAFDKKFMVEIKERITPEPSTYTQPGKILALSDIEGNFDALSKLLMGNGVIDSNYNWSFGNGHLVCNGDFFDRGEQVTECLWLIYSLEEKARKSGGYVHFILGNHEIMNLNGNMKYVQPKYARNATLLNKDYTKLWGRNSELGKWLRSKNIIEKIGDLVFVHGGVSPYINRSAFSIADINDQARTVYDAEQEMRADAENSKLYLFRSRTSPFWYRGYYKAEFKGYESDEGTKEMATMEQIDSTLTKFDISRIITGHTIVGDTISLHYNGKVINVDTHHASGRSEALLIQENRYYRVNGSGKRRLILEAEIPSNVLVSK